MKSTQIVKVNPIVENLSPILNQCRTGACGECPRGTSKLLWIPLSHNGVFDLQYNFFDKNAEQTGDVKFNFVSTSVTINGQAVSYHNPPDRNYAVTTNVSQFPVFAVSQMKGNNKLSITLSPPGWVYFKQVNTAVGNVHDALCFEYSHEKKLITFRSF